MTDAGLSERRLPPTLQAAGSLHQGVRSSRQAEHLAFARAERANIDAALDWSIVNDPPIALSLVNGFAGPGSCSATAEARNESWPPSMRPATPPARDRANALLLAGWIEASIGRLELARNHIAAATDLADTINDVDLQARCCYYLAYVVSHDGDFRQAIELTDRSDALYAAGPTVGSGRQLALRRPSRDLSRRRGAQRRRCRSRPALAANGRRPVAARSRRSGARRAGPHPAPVRRCRRPPRSRRGNVATSRLPADRGVSTVQSRTSAVPGR